MNKNIIVTLLIVVALGLAVFGAVQLTEPNTSTRDNSASSGASKFAGAVIIDVRTPQEFSETHAKQAANLPLADIQAGQMPQVEKTAKIVLYCRSGNRSSQAAELLKQADYTNVQDLGGLEDAQAAGLEFTN